MFNMILTLLILVHSYEFLWAACSPRRRQICGVVVVTALQGSDTSSSRLLTASLLTAAKQKVEISWRTAGVWSESCVNDGRSSEESECHFCSRTARILYLFYFIYLLFECTDFQGTMINNNVV